MNTEQTGRAPSAIARVVPALLVAIVLAACSASTPPSPTNAPSTAGASTAVSSGGTSSTPAGNLQPVTMNVGRFPKGAAAAFVTQYMINNHLIEDAGQTLGLNITVNWSNQANATSVAQAMLGTTLDIGPMGSSAYVGLIAQNQAVTPISIAEGHFKFVLAVQKTSPIHSLADLKGKTVGTITGSDLYNVLAEMLLAQFGSADPATDGVQIANISSVPQLATVPAGTDATIVTIPSFLQAQALGLPVTAVVDSYGMSEDAYNGPEGQGAGHIITSAQSSPFWPDGFYGHRAVFIARDAFLQQNPKAVEAFLIAQNKAIQAIQGMDPQAVASIVASDWGIVPATGQQIVKDDLLVQRGFTFITEGDAAVLSLQSQLAAQAGSIASPVGWDALKAALLKGADVSKAAYDALGDQPADSVFLDTSKDVRGYPTWEATSWKTH